VMRLTNIDNLDPKYGEILVFFNAAKDPVSISDASFQGKSYSLHPIQLESVDPVVREAAFEAANARFTIPGRTTAVFVMAQPAQPAATATILSTVTAIPALTAVATIPPTPAAAPVQAMPISIIILGVVVVLAMLGLGIYLSSRRASR
jgi:hypothetical protein